MSFPSFLRTRFWLKQWPTALSYRSVVKKWLAGGNQSCSFSFDSFLLTHLRFVNFSHDISIEVGDIFCDTPVCCQTLAATAGTPAGKERSMTRRGRGGCCLSLLLQVWDFSTALKFMGFILSSLRISFLSDAADTRLLLSATAARQWPLCGSCRRPSSAKLPVRQRNNAAFYHILFQRDCCFLIIAYALLHSVLPIPAEESVPGGGLIIIQAWYGQLVTSSSSGAFGGRSSQNAPASDAPIVSPLFLDRWIGKGVIHSFLCVCLFALAD